MRGTSWSWPNLFDVARSKVNLYSDTRSIVNRVKLLLLTEPTELYMNPNFGVGLKKYMFKYNNDNVVALIRDKLIEQLDLWEPGVIPEKTKVIRKELPQEGIIQNIEPNHLRLTITLTTSYMKEISFSVDESDYSKLL